MGNPLDKFGISETDLLATAEVDAGLNTFMETEVVPEWRRNSPGETGKEVQITKRAQGGKGQVGWMHEAANVMEYGNEKTPEYAPRARTEAKFNNGGVIDGLEHL